MGVTQLVAVVLRQPLVLAYDLARTGVEQQLVRVEAVALLRRVGAMGPQAVDQPRPGAGQKAMPQAVVRAMQRIAAQFTHAVGIEQAQLQHGRVLREDAEVDAAMAGQRAHGLGLAWQQLLGQGQGHGLRFSGSGR